MFLFGNLKGNGKLWKRSYFNFTRIGTWGRMFHALKKRNDHSKGNLSIGTIVPQIMKGKKLLFLQFQYRN